MKKIILSLMFLFLAFESQSEAKSFYYDGGVTFSYFYYSLQPFGEWIQIDNDLIVWRPNVSFTGWAPYTVGRWVWTDYGWYWDSYEPFGWATFHYGRWIYDDYYGWVWLPGYRWGPAWVEWRYNDDYIGWAPLPPYASFDVHIGIHFSFGWRAPVVYWHFVPFRYFCGYNVANYFISYNSVNYIFPRTRYRTNYDYRDGRIVNYGVDRNYVQRRSGRRIRKLNVRTVSSRRALLNGRRAENSVTVFRPNAKEIRSVRKVREFKIKKGNRTSIRIDKIAVGRNEIRVNKQRNIKTYRNSGSLRFEKKRNSGSEKVRIKKYRREVPRIKRNYTKPDFREKRIMPRNNNRKEILNNRARTPRIKIRMPVVKPSRKISRKKSYGRASRKEKIRRR